MSVREVRIESGKVVLVTDDMANDDFPTNAGATLQGKIVVCTSIIVPLVFMALCYLL
jgi:hypothetical protein